MTQKVTFKRITNPTSADFGFAAISQVVRINKQLKQVYDDYLRVKIKTHIAKKSDDHWIFWLEIPSETRDNIFYDVVIEMDKPKGVTSFLQADLKLWSNDPNFKYAYTWVINDAKQLPDWLKDKCSYRALTEKPEIRNPYSIWHLEKYIIFAKYHILSKGYLNPKYLEEDYDSDLDEQKIHDQVMHQDEKESIVKRKNIKETTVMEDVVNDKGDNK